MNKNTSDHKPEDKYADIRNALPDIAKTSDEYLLESSRQGGYVAAAIVASAGLWGDTHAWTTVVAIVLLFLSCMCVPFIHFFTGNYHRKFGMHWARFLNEDLDISERNSQIPKIKHLYEQSGNGWLSTPIRLGAAQAALFFPGSFFAVLGIFL